MYRAVTDIFRLPPNPTDYERGRAWLARIGASAGVADLEPIVEAVREDNGIADPRKMPPDSPVVLPDFCQYGVQ
jgi:hypothetical protein